MISEFAKKNFFLSNFYVRPITYEGIQYTCTESAYQAHKTLDINERIRISKLDPETAKKEGRKLPLRSDWDDVKLDVMYEICTIKFTTHPDLGKRLLATEDEELVEGNKWNDTFWGVCKGVGENNLGKILMRIRSELAAKRKLDAENELTD